ncbi:hypothetical protein SDRG_04327 [Saprolegnia diclina VS20]|uniref:Uncharacterized protein n=1 Tax=Saprolegnia diclina (strain VS20) TaxID=1156394 RepID=T0QVC9_SAPDV|nr:hypothetical protein SDRG_04327 [Saprolegnia diclina VS20]EQC38626.1 hypothetical protein SDRG_04327 [Saprolegnia diclina VS20]|eukprot:XP_008608218.1 hypothetical protein SDRG_04327 [Saprolegnia diclina VS20]
MLQRTKAALALALIWLVLAVYGIGLYLFEDSMYGRLRVLLGTATMGTLLLVVSGLGLLHLLWTRAKPSLALCLMLLVADVVFCSVVLGGALTARGSAMYAIEKAPTLTTYAHRVEAYLATAQGSYAESLSAPGAPPVPAYDEAYPNIAAYYFNTAYCDAEGNAYCRKWPLNQTLVRHGLWANTSGTAAVTKALATLPTTLANVAINATTTIDSFCAAAKTEALDSEMKAICQGCAKLRRSPRERKEEPKLATWVHTTCPMTAPSAAGIFCIYWATSCSSCLSDWRRTTLEPSHDECFGFTLQTTIRQWADAIAITSGLLLLSALWLGVCVWRWRRAAQKSETVDLTPDNWPSTARSRSF